jgi:hypothetical protein
MTTKQAAAYLDGVHRHFSEKGIVLTDPGDLLLGSPQPLRDATLSEMQP